MTASTIAQDDHTSQASTTRQTYRLTDDGWQRRAAVDPDSPAGQIQHIRRLLAQDQPGEAYDLADAWIDAHPKHPLMPEAYLLRADAQVAEHSYYDALFDYEFLLRTYPAAQQFTTALEREFEIARLFVEGYNRKLWGMRILPAEGEGEELLIRIQERAPGSAIGERASLQLADYYYQSGQMGLAAEAYDLFLENYPNSRVREWAILQAIYASLARFKGPSFDQTGLIEAKQRIKQYAQEFPAEADRAGTDQLLVRIDESLAQRDYQTASWYHARGQTVSEVFLLRRLVQDYPDTAAGQRAVDRLQSLGERVVVPKKSGDQGNKGTREQGNVQ